MATAAAPDMVWVGFMDVVPVIGTVKEIVEWILAVYENNKEVVMEKEQQIIGLLQSQVESQVLVMQLLMETQMKLLDEEMEREEQPETPKASQQDGPEEPETSGAGASEFSGLKNIREVKQTKLIENVSSGSRRKPGKTVSEKENEKLEKIRKDIQEKLQLIGLDGGLAQGLHIEIDCPKRGEHVFNNGLLKFHSKILSQFEKNILDSFRFSIDFAKYSEEPPLSTDTEEEIATRMIVDIEDGEFYVNANAVLYGRYSEALRDAINEMLNCKDPRRVSREKKEKFIRITYLMNKHEIYVDHLAKEKWIRKESKTKLSGRAQAEERSRHLRDGERFGMFIHEERIRRLQVERYLQCLSTEERFRRFFQNVQVEERFGRFRAKEGFRCVQAEEDFRRFLDEERFRSVQAEEDFGSVQAEECFRRFLDEEYSKIVQAEEDYRRFLDEERFRSVQAEGRVKRAQAERHLGHVPKEERFRRVQAERHLGHVPKEERFRHVQAERHLGHVPKEERFRRVQAEKHFRSVQAEVIFMYCIRRGYGWCINILTKFCLIKVKPEVSQVLESLSLF